MINFTFGYQAVFNIEMLILKPRLCQVDLFRAFLILIRTCTSLKVIFLCTYLYSPCSLTRCGTTAAIDPVCERVTSESSVLLNVTHGEVNSTLRYSVLFVSLISSHCNIVIDYRRNIVISSYKLYTFMYLAYAGGYLHEFIDHACASCVLLYNISVIYFISNYAWCYFFRISIIWDYACIV